MVGVLGFSGHFGGTKRPILRHSKHVTLNVTKLMIDFCHIWCFNPRAKTCNAILVVTIAEKGGITQSILHIFTRWWFQIFFSSPWEIGSNWRISVQMVEAQPPDFDSFPSRIQWNVQGFVAIAQDRYFGCWFSYLYSLTRQKEHLLREHLLKVHRHIRWIQFATEGNPHGFQ